MMKENNEINNDKTVSPWKVNHKQTNCMDVGIWKVSEKFREEMKNRDELRLSSTRYKGRVRDLSQ